MQGETEMDWVERSEVALASLAGVGVVLLDRSMVVQWASSTAKAIVGAEVIGMAGLDLVHPDDLDAVVDVLAHHQDSEFYRGRDLRLHVPLGRQLRIRTNRAGLDGICIPGWQVVLARAENRFDDPSVGALVVRLEMVGDQSGLGTALDLLSSGADVNDTIAEILRYMRAENPYAHIGFVWWDERGRQVLAEGIDPSDVALLTHPLLYANCAAERGGERCTTMLVEDSAFVVKDLEATRSVADRLGDRAVAVVPIRRSNSRGSAMGVLLYWSPYDYRVILSPQMAITVASDLLVLALNDHERREQLRDQARRDALTGVLNRVGLAVAAATMRDFFVLYVDLDDFKPVNDRYGHQTGDHVLVEVAARLLRSCREGDVVARLGGDEFVLLCGEGRVPGDTCLDPSAFAQRLVAVIAEPIRVGADEVSVSACVGVARSVAECDLDEVLAQADAALYEAKRSGRAGSVICTVG